MTTLNPRPLVSKSIFGYEVSSWVVEPTLTSNPNCLLDEVFTIDLRSLDSRSLDEEKRTSIVFKRTVDFEHEDVKLRLRELYEDDYADNCVYEVMQESYEQLVEEEGRGSLALIVEILRVEEEHVFVELTNMNPEEDTEDDYEKQKKRRMDMEGLLLEKGIIRPIIKEGDSTKDMGCCPICLEEFDKSYIDGAFLDCSHVLHAECLISWILKKKNTCPMCQNRFIPCDDLI